ncbi:MAG: inorganic phosphate transporter [Promethearchaeota archaeon]|nr:MAG: inorganic phosphate transporter [Candidatus Lokiarchaeota archaeon]
MAENLTFILTIILIIMGISLAFSIGANDETLAPLVGANVLRFRVALLIGGIATGFGMIFFSQGVGKTVGADILGPGIQYSIFMLLSVLISSIIWLIVGSFIGIPLSSTHSTIGSIFGVVLVYSIFRGGINPILAFNYEKLGSVVLSWFLSPLFGLIVTFVLFRVIAKSYLSKLKGLNQIENTERKIKWILFFSVIFAEIWVGANSAECIGIFYGLFYSGSINSGQYYFFVIICGIFVFLGIYFAGRYVIKNLASQMTGARPSEGLILQSSSSLILMIATLLSLPISHSHVVVFSIIGLNLAQKKEISKKSIGKMSLYWFLTFPIAAILASLIYLGFIILGFN